MVELDVGLFRYSHAIQVGPRDTVEVLHVKTFVARVEEYYGVPLVYTGRVNQDVTFLAPNEYHPCRQWVNGAIFGGQDPFGV